MPAPAAIAQWLGISTGMARTGQTRLTGLKALAPPGLATLSL
jgi:hypothetical protein